MADVEFHEGLDPSLVDELLALFEREWWTKGRSREDVERMLAGTGLVLSAVSSDGRLVGFGRAVTDGVYRAAITDVIVDSDLRGVGLGAEMMRRLVDHPAVASVPRIELICLEEMVPFYEALGYEVAPADHKRMVWTRPQH